MQDTPGFIVNRLLSPYLAEAIRMVERGRDVSCDDDTMHVVLLQYILSYDQLWVASLTGQKEPRDVLNKRMVNESKGHDTIIGMMHSASFQVGLSTATLCDMKITFSGRIAFSNSGLLLHTE